MELPNLPKKYNRKEAKIDSLVLDWFAKNYYKSVAVEVKIKSKIKEHQQIALNEVQSGVFKYKIVDSGVCLPFDGFVLKNADAFVVTCEGNSCTAVRQSPDDPCEFKIKISQKG